MNNHHLELILESKFKKPLLNLSVFHSWRNDHRENWVLSQVENKRMKMIYILFYASWDDWVKIFFAEIDTLYLWQDYDIFLALQTWLVFSKLMLMFNLKCIYLTVSPSIFIGVSLPEFGIVFIRLFFWIVEIGVIFAT